MSREYHHAVGLSRKDLGAGEEIVLSLRPTPTPLVLPSIILAGGVALAVLVLTRASFAPHELRIVGAIVLVAAASVWFLARLVAWRSRALVLTTFRVLVIKGVLSSTQDQISLQRIEGAQVRRSVRHRLLGRGDLIVELVDGSGVVIEDVPKPQAFCRLMLRTRDGEEVAAQPAVEGSSSPAPRMVRVVTEGDPTPPRGVPAVNASQAAVIEGRLKEVEALERSGHLTAEEASQRRAAILEQS